VQQHTCDNNETRSRWEKKFVTVKALVFDADSGVCFFDSVEEKQEFLMILG
jgi:hypothetical protein